MHGQHASATIVKEMIDNDMLHGLNSSTSTGILPLRIAINAGRLDYVRAFLETGALVTAPTATARSSTPPWTASTRSGTRRVCDSRIDT